MTYYSKSKKTSKNYASVVGYSLIAAGFVILVYLLLSLPSLQQRFSFISKITEKFPLGLQLNKKPPHVSTRTTYAQPAEASKHAEQYSTDDSVSLGNGQAIKPESQIVSDGSGLAPVYYRINTKQLVVFLGFDDGIVKN